MYLKLYKLLKINLNIKINLKNLTSKKLLGA